MIEAKLYSVNDERVANEKDFDDSTGEVLQNSRSNSKIVVLNEQSAQTLMDWLSGREGDIKPVFEISDTQNRKSSKKAPLPFITSTLQQEASKKHGYSPSRTMSIAQRLYENGFITYMRTDSPTLSDTAKDVAMNIVTKKFGVNYLNDEQETTGKSRKKKDLPPKNAQEAHEAIRPADKNGVFEEPSATKLDGDEFTLYSLIYRRTLASVMKSCESLTTTVTITALASGIENNAFSEAIFRSSETITTFDGYLAAINVHSAAKEKQLAALSAISKLKRGDILQLSLKKPSNSNFSEEADILEDNSEIETAQEVSEQRVSHFSKDYPGLKSIEHVTRPPTRYTEASFIKELESIGVGRPSTYSTVLQILRERGYILVDRQTIVPSLKGMVVSSLLEKHFPQLVDEKFTAEMEKNLDLIANGQFDKNNFLKRFYLEKRTNAEGLLMRVARKLVDNEIDPLKSRTIELPFIKNVTFQINKFGAYALRPDNDTDMILRYKLPESMEIDIREITEEKINHLIATGFTSDGLELGIDPDTNKPVRLRTGRFGEFLQVGDDKDKQKKTYSIPKIKNGEMNFEEILVYTKLPKNLGLHPSLNSSVILEVSGGVLSLGVDGNPLRVPVPSEFDLRDINLELSLQLLPEDAVFFDSFRNLGEWNGETVTIRNGRFGYYVKCGSELRGLKKLDHRRLTLDEAISLLQQPKPLSRRKKAPSIAKNKQGSGKSVKTSMKKVEVKEKAKKSPTKQKSLKSKAKPKPKAKPRKTDNLNADVTEKSKPRKFREVALSDKD